MDLKKLEAIEAALKDHMFCSFSAGNSQGEEGASVFGPDILKLVKIVRAVNTLCDEHKEAPTMFDAAIIAQDSLNDIRDMLTELQ